MERPVTVDTTTTTTTTTTSTWWWGTRPALPESLGSSLQGCSRVTWDTVTVGYSNHRNPLYVYEGFHCKLAP